MRYCILPLGLRKAISDTIDSVRLTFTTQHRVARLSSVVQFATKVWPI